jgi:hypothetical protein
MKLNRLREGVLGVAGGREDRVDDRGGVLGGSIKVALADNSSPNISFLISALYILSASSSTLSVMKVEIFTPLSINLPCTVLLSRFGRGVIRTFQKTKACL